MSSRALAARYSQRVGGGYGGTNDVDLFGLKRRGRIKEAQAMSDIDVEAEKKIAEMQHQYEIHRLQLEADLKKQLDAQIAKDSRVTEYLKQKGISEDSMADYIANVEKKDIANQSRVEDLKTGALSKTEEIQPSVDFGVRSSLTGMDPNKMAENTPADTVTTRPSVPGLTAPLATGIGLQTIQGPRRESTSQKTGGFFDTKTGQQIPEKETISTRTLSGAPIGYPVSQAILDAVQNGQSRQDEVTTEPVTSEGPASTINPTFEMLGNSPNMNPIVRNAMLGFSPDEVSPMPQQDPAMTLRKRLMQMLFGGPALGGMR